MKHRHVTTEWSTAECGCALCVCCGFAMIGENRILTVRHPRGVSATICDGCVNAIAAEADSKIVYASGEVKPA